MFFAPVIRSDSMLPEPASLDFGFERFMNEAFRGLAAPWYDLQEDDQSWTLSMDMPGVSREHLAVSVEGRTLRVQTTEGARRQYRASYELPQEIDAEGSSASLQDGVLTLRIAKARPANVRQITVG